MLVVLILMANPATDLATLGRFPTLGAANAQIGALIRVRYALKQTDPSEERDEAIRFNGRQLRAWELLLEARGGLAEEEGGSGDEETCRRALAELRKLLSDDDWKAGQMP